MDRCWTATTSGCELTKSCILMEVEAELLASDSWKSPKFFVLVLGLDQPRSNHDHGWLDDNQGNHNYTVHCGIQRNVSLSLSLALAISCSSLSSNECDSVEIRLAQLLAKGASTRPKMKNFLLLFQPRHSHLLVYLCVCYATRCSHDLTLNSSMCGLHTS